MINNEISKFMALAPLIVPDLISTDNVTETDITDDCAILYFSFGEKLPIGIVMDSCDKEMELLMLYHASSEQNSQLQHCCFFPMPKSGVCMFKINIVTDSHGLTDGLTATIYDAPEILEQALEADLTAHSKGFSLTDAIKAGELLSLFMDVM